jgi:adenylylsulfate kinase-like enzyme
VLVSEGLLDVIQALPVSGANIADVMNVKGETQRALCKGPRGRSLAFTGIDGRYERPSGLEFRLDTFDGGPRDCLLQLLEMLPRPAG